MTSNDKQHAHILFLQAVEMNQQQRVTFLHQECEDNEEMLQYIEDLLLGHEASDDFFEELESTITATHLNEIEDHLFRDSDFGNYQIISVIKQGGMGTLFLAKRADGEFERKVVIKMLPFDLNFNQSQSQFAHEKEILASLIHPNIVQLYDSGVTAKGESYFVMELVKGKTLIEHCNDNKLSIAQRLDLFQDVLKAVGFAHQHLVIHGDIKPSNIMVNEEGQIRLLDFGIAKLVYKNEVEIEGYSLNYLTPEHKYKKPIITTTDIHQLGQLLFELLTNIAPKEVRGDEFEFPNLALITKNNEFTVNQILKNSGLKRNELINIFNSDLGYIVAKCLSKQPTNRYKTVQALGEDLKLYLQGYCIKARSNTLYYRFSKYLKRNKLLSLLVVSLILMSMVFAWQVNQHYKELAQERDKAVAVKNLITDVFSAADPSFVPGKELTATEVLDIGLKRVRVRFKEHSDIEADLLQEMAHTYQNIGNYEKAQSILQEVYQIRQQLFPKDEILKAKSMLLLGENSRLMSNNKQAKDWLTQSLEIFNQDRISHAQFIASAKSKLGRVMVLLGDLKQAEVVLDEATELTLSIYQENSFEYAQALNDLSSVYFRQGKYQRVQQLLTQTKTIRESLLENQEISLVNKDYATNINNLGLAYYLQGQLPEGEKYFKQANSLRNQIYAKPHPEQAQSLTNLGLLLNDAGRPDEAFPYLQQALKVRQLTLAPGHMRINDAWNNLAMSYHENSDFFKAEEIYKDIMGKVIGVRGEKHPQSLSLMTNRANTLLELNEFNLAHELFEKSLTLRLKALPEGHLYLSYSYIGLGRAKVALTEIEAGKQLLEKALVIRQQKLPADHWLLGEAIYALSMVNYIQAQADLKATETACEILQKSKGENNHLTIKCETLLEKIQAISNH